MDRFCRSYDEVFQSKAFLDAVSYAVDLQDETTQNDIKAIFDKIKNDEILSDSEYHYLLEILRRKSVLDRAKVRFNEISKHRAFNGNANAKSMNVDGLSQALSFIRRLLWTEHWFDCLIDEIKKKAGELVVND